MNKKEILEIRRLFRAEDCRAERIRLCYVNGEKERVTEMKEAFLSLPEEELHKYAAIFRKALSGTAGKNLLTLEFPLAAEDEEGTQAFLMKLRDSRLQDEELVSSFYDRVIASYLNVENFLILLAYGNYDVPGRANDGLMMEDASEEVYSFILCCICPVPQTKAGLSYEPHSNTFIDRVRDRMVQMPDAAFLFPAFTDRSSDIHSVLYYAANDRQIHPEIVEDILGCAVPMAAGEQKETFNSLIEETFAEGCDFEVAKNVHENLNALLEGTKEEPHPAPLEKEQIRHLLADCGADPEQLERFEQISAEQEKAAAAEGGNDCDDGVHGDHPSAAPQLLVSNLASARRFEVKSDDIKIQVAASRTDLIETRVIDGQEYILIPVTGNVEVNGIRIRHAVQE